jgi:hypothetical protein
MANERPEPGPDDPFFSRPSHWPPPVYDHPLPQRLHDIGAGRAQMPVQTGRRHHYVPQWVLRGFEAPTKPKHIMHLEQRSGRTRLVSISSAGWAPRLYGARGEDDEYDNRIESFLGLVEGYAAPALARLIDGQATASEDEGMPISLFFGLQLSRTPVALDGIGTMFERTGQAEMMRILSDPEAFAAMLSQSRGQILCPDDVEQDRREYLKAFKDGVTLRLAGKRDVGLDVMVTSFIEAGLAMAHADWWILHPQSGSFVLNDCGYARFGVDERLPIARGIVFPMRPDACIVVAPPTSDGTQIFRAATSAAETQRINLRTYGWASRFIFGHLQAAVTDVHAAARKDRRRSRPPTELQRLPGPP